MYQGGGAVGVVHPIWEKYCIPELFRIADDGDNKKQTDF